MSPETILPKLVSFPQSRSSLLVKKTAAVFAEPRSGGMNLPQSKDKDRADKRKKGMMGKVKKVVKKSRRRLDEERFEKEVERTISFLRKLITKINKPPAKRKPAPSANHRRKQPEA